MTGRLRSLVIGPRLAAWLPGTSANFGPPRRLGGIRATVPRLGGKIWPIDDRQAVPEARPRYYGHVPEQLPPETPAGPVPATVFELPNARLLGPDGAVVGEDDTLLIDHSFWGWSKPYRPDRHTVYVRKKSPPLTRLAGRVLSLGTDFGVGSFGHLLHDGVARLQLIRAAGFRLEQFDWVYLPRPDSPSVRDVEALLDFPRERILNWQQGRDLAVDSLTAASYPGEHGRISVEGAVLLRDLAQARWGARGRHRIYLTRQGRRRSLVNEKEILDLLAPFGFLTMDPAGDAGVVSACANAEIILGVDGSNLANLAFAPPGAQVIVLMPPGGIPIPYNLSLAASGGRHLHVIAGEGSGNPDQPYLADFRMPPARLRAVLEQLI